MKAIKQYIHTGISIGLSLLCLISNSSCEEFVNVDPPQTDLIRSTVFTSDATATAAISDIYYRMISIGFAKGDISSLTFIASLSSDELQNYNAGGGNQDYYQFNDNGILPTNTKLTNLWSEPYQNIYRANAIIEGLNSSAGVSTSLKNQLIGEALFLRAFHHFYLFNLFGDIPLVLTTDYLVNSRIPRTSKAEVYQQIVSDLIEAQNLLSNDYSFSGNEKVRPNKWVALALLSRAYLYIGDWHNAEMQATNVIDNIDAYTLEADLNEVFLKNSSEAIWQLVTSSGAVNTWEGFTFIFNTTPNSAALTTQFVNGFEVGDNRKVNWIGSTSDGIQTYYYPYKYKLQHGSTPLVEYSMVLRLAEQYLIRAEARAQQDNFNGSISDVDIIRQRAGLQLFQNTNPSMTKSDLLLAIENERRSELFTEWGHRWLDLKRTNRIDHVLGTVKNNWATTDALYPIPQIQIDNDPAMNNSQNPGY